MGEAKTVSNVTQQITARQGLTILNEARKRAPLSYREHAECDQVFAGLDMMMAQSDAIAAGEAKRLDEAKSNGKVRKK